MRRGAYEVGGTDHVTSSWTIPQLLEATQGQLAHGSLDGVVDGISIDSRTLTPGEAFLAIHGPRYDGHAFLEDARRRGAACLIVSRHSELSRGEAALPKILVEDTQVALGRLARAHRRRIGCPVIAVTGTCGKTTTKELIAHLLGDPEVVLKTTGTQNNHIGVPMTLLRMRSTHQWAVIELGSNHPGEIAALAAIAEPDIAVLTNIGPGHLEFFGSLEGVLKEKLSVVEALPRDGTAVLPGDQLEVCLEARARLTATQRVVTFGTTDQCDLQATAFHPTTLDRPEGPCAARTAASGGSQRWWDHHTTDGMVMHLRDHVAPWVLPLVGAHNVENALAAAACVWAMGVPLSVAKARLATCAVVPLRSQLLQCEGLSILNDCYNANPLSVARALETLRMLSVRRRVAIVGDMLELGADASSAHQAIGRLAARLGIDEVLAVGMYAEDVARGVREGGEDTSPNDTPARTPMAVNGHNVRTYRTVQELIEHLPGIVQRGDGLLIKGSRALHLEQVTALLLHAASCDDAVVAQGQGV